MKSESNTNQFILSSSPHAHDGSSVERIMLDVLIALIPAFVAAIWFFGLDALRLTAICVISCLATEWLCRKAMRRNSTLTDYSAALTGLLLAFNLPPSLPAWMAIAGSIFAIAVAKQVFGGLGYNPFNPALAGRAFMLVSFTGAMTSWSRSSWVQHAGWKAADATTSASVLAVDAMTNATPLGIVKDALKNGEPLPILDTSAMIKDLLLGNINGCIGETSAIALLLGLVWLLYRRVITWHIPVAYIATVALYAAIQSLIAPATSLPPHVHLLTGGLLLGAIFMATDMVTSPVTRTGMLIFGVGCGIVTMLIRTVKSGAYPEGVSFAILVMNAFTPLINRATRHRIFGGTRKSLTNTTTKP